MYTSLNETGKEHVAKRLAELCLDWDHQATFDDIANKCTDVPDGDHPRAYEVSQHESKSGQIEYIELMPEHFNVVSVED